MTVAHNAKRSRRLGEALQPIGALLKKVAEVELEREGGSSPGGLCGSWQQHGRWGVASWSIWSIWSTIYYYILSICILYSWSPAAAKERLARHFFSLGSKLWPVPSLLLPL